jgi:hypothetical protein
MGLFYRLLFTVLYLAGCFVFAVTMLGGGHGTLLFATPLLTVWAFGAGILLLNPDAKRGRRVLAAGLVLFHYVLTPITAYLVETGDGFNHTVMVLRYSPWAFALPSIWYFAGNAVFWILFFRTRSAPDPLP